MRRATRSNGPTRPRGPFSPRPQRLRGGYLPLCRLSSRPYKGLKQPLHDPVPALTTAHALPAPCAGPGGASGSSTQQARRPSPPATRACGSCEPYTRNPSIPCGAFCPDCCAYALQLSRHLTSDHGGRGPRLAASPYMPCGRPLVRRPCTPGSPVAHQHCNALISQKTMPLTMSTQHPGTPAPQPAAKARAAWR